MGQSVRHCLFGIAITVLSIIYGVINAATAEALIKSYAIAQIGPESHKSTRACPNGLVPGVFIVRFFEGNDAAVSGRPVITYVTAEATIQHYKLTDKEKKTPFHVRNLSLFCLHLTCNLRIFLPLRKLLECCCSLRK